MNVYVYLAALLCGDCGAATRRNLRKLRGCPVCGEIESNEYHREYCAFDPEDERSYDSDEYPKGPYPDGGGESDCPQHCDQCGEFLENSLTSDGRAYVREAVEEASAAGRADSPALTIWAEFYEVTVA